MKRKHQKTKTPTAQTPRSVIEMPADPEEGKKVVRLTRRFIPPEAGESKESQANLLAAMALTITNIGAAHRVACVGYQCTRMGTGFAVEGGLLAADFSVTVMEPLLRLQERMERNLLHDVEADSTFFRGKTQPSDEAREQRVLDKSLLPKQIAKKAFLIAGRQSVNGRLAANNPGQPAAPNHPVGPFGDMASTQPNSTPPDKNAEVRARQEADIRQIYERASTRNLAFMILKLVSF